MQIECDSVEFELKLNVIQFCLFDGNLQLSNSFFYYKIQNIILNKSGGFLVKLLHFFFSPICQVLTIITNNFLMLSTTAYLTAMIGWTFEFICSSTYPLGQKRTSAIFWVITCAVDSDLYFARWLQIILKVFAHLFWTASLSICFSSEFNYSSSNGKKYWTLTKNSDS